MPLIDLLPCPFCGGEAKLYQSDPRLPGSSCNVECPGCGSESAWFISADLAITAWNTRAMPTVQPEPAPALGAEWERGIKVLIMEAQNFVRRVEAGEIRSKRTYNAFVDCLNVIGDAIPDPTEADLDRAALARPKVRALVDAIDRFAESEPPYGPDCWEAVKAAIADLKGGA
jgi:Lar family restriction alleviation protein